jgi:hypothetical protein
MSDSASYCRATDQHAAVVEVLHGEFRRLVLPEVGSLAEKILTCIAINGSVAPSEVDCKTDMPRFLAAASALMSAGYPIDCQSDKPIRWAWSWRLQFVCTDERAEHPYLIDGEHLLRLKPLREWAIARCVAASV